MRAQLDRKNQKSNKQMREEMIIKLFYLTIGRNNDNDIFPKVSFVI